MTQNGHRPRGFSFPFGAQRSSCWCGDVSGAVRDRARTEKSVAGKEESGEPGTAETGLTRYAVPDEPCMTRLTTMAAMPASTALACGDDSMPPRISRS
jgi:hypothetical protein